MIALHYLGTREYVNGLTLFEAMLQAFTRQHPVAAPIEVALFKVTQFVHTDCRLEVIPADERGAASVRTAAARVELTAGAEAFTLLLVPLAERPVTERRDDYDRTAYVEEVLRDAAGTAYARFRNVGDAYDLLRGLIEVNHQLTRAESMALGVDENPSWAYMTHYRLLPPADLVDLPQARFTTKGITNAQGRRYTIRTVEVSGWARPMELCFFTRVP